MRQVAKTLFVIVMLLSAEAVTHAQNVKIPEVAGTATNWTWQVPQDITNASNITEVSRDGDTVRMKVLTHERLGTVTPFKLAKINQADAETKEHSCKPSKDAANVNIKFTAEAFERIFPPNDEEPPAATPENPVEGLQITQRSGFVIHSWGKMTVQQASGRFYWNGEVHQVFTKFVATLEKEGKTITWTPKASSVKDATSTPRFDGSKIYNAQVRIFTGSAANKTHVAVVAIDMPSLRASSGPRGMFVDEVLSTSQPMTFEVDFETYFFEDCNLDGSAELPTHRIDWKLRTNATTGATHPFTDFKGKSIKDNDTKANKDPDVGTGTSHAKAENNDAGTVKGWDPRTGQYDKKIQ